MSSCSCSWSASSSHRLLRPRTPLECSLCRLSSSSVRPAPAALSGALEDALKQGMIVRNVAKLVDLPLKERYEGHILTVEQARMKMGDRWREHGLIFSN